MMRTGPIESHPGTMYAWWWVVIVVVVVMVVVVVVAVVVVMKGSGEGRG
jgi:hypothetical protein